MDFKQIQELVKIVNKSNIGELSIEEKEFKITIKQKKEYHTQVVTQANNAVYTPVATTNAATALQTQSAVSPAVTAAPTESTNLITIKSPMIGTFYRKSAPDKPLLAEVGDEINKGKVVCIIEAMKLFNEIESEISGRIVKVLAEDASPVEYDQPLFLVEPA